MSDALINEIVKVVLDLSEIPNQTKQLRRLIDAELNKPTPGPQGKDKAGLFLPKGDSALKKETREFAHDLDVSIAKSVRQNGMRRTRQAIANSLMLSGKISPSQARLIAPNAGINTDRVARNLTQGQLRAIGADLVKQYPLGKRPNISPVMAEDSSRENIRAAERSVAQIAARNRSFMAAQRGVYASQEAMDKENVRAAERSVARLAEQRRAEQKALSEQRRNMLSPSNAQDFQGVSSRGSQEFFNRRAPLVDISGASRANNVGGRLSAAPIPTSGINTRGLSRGLRFGAGVSVAAGNFQAAGAMYALANAAGAIGEIQVKSKAAQTALTGVKTGLGALGIAAAGVAVPLLLMKSALDLDKQLMDVSTLAFDTSVSLKEVRIGMRDLAEEGILLSGIYGRDLTDTLTAFKTALSAGVERNELMTFVGAAGELAAGLGTDMNKSIDILTTFRDAYGLTASELGKVNDALFNVIDVGKVNINDLINSLGRVIPVANNVGASINDVFTAIAGLTRRGFKSNVAATSLNQMFEVLLRPSDKGRAAAARYGIEVGAGAIERMGGIGATAERLRGIGAEGRSEIFRESRSLRAASGLAQMTGLLDELSVAIDRAGTAAKAAERAQANYSDTMKKWFDLLKNNLKLVGLDLLQDLFGDPNLSKGKIEELALSFTKMGNAVKSTIETTMDILPVAIGSIFGPGGLLVGGVISLYGTLKEYFDGTMDEKQYAKRDRERRAVDRISDTRQRAGAEFDRVIDLPGMRGMFGGSIGTNMFDKELMRASFGTELKQLGIGVERFSNTLVISRSDLERLRAKYIDNQVSSSNLTDALDKLRDVAQGFTASLAKETEKFEQFMGKLSQAALDAQKELDEINEKIDKKVREERLTDVELKRFEQNSELIDTLKQLIIITESELAQNSDVTALLRGTMTRFAEIGATLADDTGVMGSRDSSGIIDALRELLFKVNLESLNVSTLANSDIFQGLMQAPRGKLDELGAMSRAELENALIADPKIAETLKNQISEAVLFASRQVSAAMQNAVFDSPELVKLRKELEELTESNTALNDRAKDRPDPGIRRRQRDFASTTRVWSEMNQDDAFDFFEERQMFHQQKMLEAMQLGSDDLFNDAKDRFLEMQSAFDSLQEESIKAQEDFNKEVEDLYKEDVQNYKDAMKEKQDAVKDLDDDIKDLNKSFSEAMGELGDRRIEAAKSYLNDRQASRVIEAERAKQLGTFNSAVSSGDFDTARDALGRFSSANSDLIGLSSKGNMSKYRGTLSNIEEESRMTEQLFESEKGAKTSQRDEIYRQMSEMIQPSVQAALDKVTEMWKDKKIEATIENAQVNLNVVIPGAQIAGAINPSDLAGKITEAIGQVEYNRERGVDINRGVRPDGLARRPAPYDPLTPRQPAVNLGGSGK